MVYKKIYETINDTLDGYGMKLSISESVACEIAGKNPYIIEMQEFDSFDLEELVEYAYYRCLNTIPDEKAYDKLYAKAGGGKNVSTDEFRLYLLLKINVLMRTRHTGKKIRGINEYYEKLYADNSINKRQYNRFRRISRLAKYQAVIGADVIYPLWMKLPVEKRQTIKKILRRV